MVKNRIYNCYEINNIWFFVLIYKIFYIKKNKENKNKIKIILKFYKYFIFDKNIWWILYISRFRMRFLWYLDV